MIERAIRRFWKVGLVVAVSLLATAGIALASTPDPYANEPVIFGTNGTAGETINVSSLLTMGPFFPPGTGPYLNTQYVHVYGFGGSDTINVNNTPSGTGFNLIYGDGMCPDNGFSPPSAITVYPPHWDENYCEHPFPWLPQWSGMFQDTSSQTDTITESGGGPSWLIGGAGDNVITGGTGKDVIVGGPRNDTLTGAAGGGSSIISIYNNNPSFFSVLVKGTDPPNYVDVYNTSRSFRATVTCAAGNKDVVFENIHDSYMRCAKVFHVAPCFPDNFAYSGGTSTPVPCNYKTAKYPFVLPPGMDTYPFVFARDATRSARSHARKTARHHRISRRHHNRTHRRATRR